MLRDLSPSEDTTTYLFAQALIRSYRGGGFSIGQGVSTDLPGDPQLTTMVRRMLIDSHFRAVFQRNLDRYFVDAIAPEDEWGLAVVMLGSPDYELLGIPEDSKLMAVAPRSYFTDDSPNTSAMRRERWQRTHLFRLDENAGFIPMPDFDIRAFLPCRD